MLEELVLVVKPCGEAIQKVWLNIRFYTQVVKNACGLGINTFLINSFYKFYNHVFKQVQVFFRGVVFGFTTLYTTLIIN